ncbi:putative peptidoglycan binding domain-containing protein [Promicromonospora thailandica]|uniref:Peptidoglycan binding domain-containing protein n=2 Tax=Promicromonospora thailandica TaxID=765201 RepID=A0A9X2G781_9MICO|nr:putative peptidoglycan binding domain-containing protein [Promicromonospora thailandica]
MREVYTDGAYYRMPARGTTTTCWLAYDRSYSNPAVSALQRHIKLCYIDRDWISWSGTFSIDGFFGDDTLNALKKVQAYHGLSQDGEYGPTTRSTMHVRWSEDPGGGGRVGCGSSGYFD